MRRIDMVYRVSHTHTDIGYTDYQDMVFCQQCGFIDRAADGRG